MTVWNNHAVNHPTLKKPPVILVQDQLTRTYGRTPTSTRETY